MRLSGVELRNFRSIGSQPVVLRPLRRCNILVGQNNAGKSNVLKALKLISARYQSTKEKPPLSELDLHGRSDETPFLFRLWFDSDGAEEWEVKAAKQSGINSFWFDLSWERGGVPKVVDHVFANIDDFTVAEGLFQELAHLRWTRRIGPDVIRRDFLSCSEPVFGRFIPAIPPLHIIPEFRQVRHSSQYGLDGAGLVELLAHYQMPEIGKDEDQAKFERIQEFMRRLLHLPTAMLEVSRTNPTMILKNEGLRLPLSSFGTGVHELIILVTAVLSVDNAICCIEEPEIHLHPRLQRELIQFLVNETTSLYLMTTHSPALIDIAASSSSDAQVFHVQLRDGATVGGPVLGETDALCALRDLGISASSLLQANCIIWVEGPSDQVYMRRWLELLAPELEEGRDYVFMCYREMQRLSFDSQALVDRAVNVLRVNQNAILVMDSDRSEPDADLGEAKQRIKEDCERAGGVCLVTDGREIENHLPARVLVEACEALRGCRVHIALGLFDEFETVLNRALKQAAAEHIDYGRHKGEYSRKFAEVFQETDFSPQLRAQLERVVGKIREWGH